ncbi:MAG: hypothetical protein M3044_13415 [Thermoproteota archaeon]|nr:hypothetical protein [Thermoproteota archaeon]
MEEDLILGEPGEEDEETEMELIEDVEGQLKDDIDLCRDTYCFLREIEPDIDVLQFGLKHRLSAAKKKCLLVILNNIDNLYEDQEEEE